MNTQTSKQIIIKYGLITGGVSILLTLLSYLTGNAVKPNVLISVISFFLPIILIILGIKTYKTANNGFISWKESVKIGIGIAIIWGILSLVFQYILETYIDPTIFDQKLQYTVTSLQKWGLDDDKIEEVIKQTKESQNSISAKIMGILGFLLVGFITSAITGLIIKKNEDDINFE